MKKVNKKVSFLVFLSVAFIILFSILFLIFILTHDSFNKTTDYFFGGNWDNLMWPRQQTWKQAVFYVFTSIC